MLDIVPHSSTTIQKRLRTISWPQIFSSAKIPSFPYSKQHNRKHISRKILNTNLQPEELFHQHNVKWFGSHNLTTQLFWTATPILPEAPRHFRTGWMQTMCVWGTLRVLQMLLNASEVHQQNVNLSGSHTQSSQTLRVTTPVLLSTSRCSQTPLELSNVLSDSARAFSGAPESTCSYGGAFRMLQDLTYRIVKFWSSWDVCTDLWETSRAAGTAVQLCGRLWEQLRTLHSTAGNLVPYSHSSGFYTTTSNFVLSYSSLLQSKDSLHHNMACII